MTEVLDQKKSTIDQLLTDEEDEDDEEEDINEDEEDESGGDGEDGEGSEEEGSYTMDTDELPQVKTENDPKPPKVKAVGELTQADDENSSNAPAQQTGRKRKRKRGGGDKSKKKKSKNAKPVTLRRNIRDIIKENDLDKQTLNAQQEEAERRQRILEVQKALEEQRKKEKEENDSQLKSLLQNSDIIELSSDEEDVLLTKDEDSDVDPEDPNNAGNHINDALNAHDDFGRVLVNIGHPSDEPDIFLAPQIARYIKKHQIGGVRFLYDNLIESLSRFHNSPGFGCILVPILWTHDLPQVKTENDPKPPKVKAIEELTQADNENSSKAPAAQQTGRKRKRKRGGG
uniref:Helicase ARIP4 n=1 Tax=Magallana gigas TaxID=29159 RepID=K1QU65_MAGGI